MVRQRFLSVFFVVLGSCLPSMVQAQIITVLPNQIPNGVTSPSRFKQRINIEMGSDTGLSRSFTITMPPEVSVVANSVTATSTSGSLVAFFAGSPSSSTLAFGLTGSTTARTVTIEFDVRTPNNYTGIASGSALDTVYTVDFAPTLTNNTDKTPRIMLHQNKRIRMIQFTSPDSAAG